MADRTPFIVLGLLLALPATVSAQSAVGGTNAVLAAPGDSVTLSLAEALAAASEGNLTLAALETRLDQAAGQLRQARGLLLPMLSAGASWNHADHEDTVDFGASMADLFSSMGFPVSDELSGDPMVVRQQDEVSGSLTASLAVLNPQMWATWRVAQRGRDLTGDAVEQARQALLLGVAQAWYGARMAGALVQVQQEREASTLQHLDVAERRLAAGAGLRIDVVRARTDLAQARQDLLSARLASESARDALGVLTGAGSLPVPGAAPALQVPGDAPEVLTERALAAREDVRVARDQVALARSALGLAWSQFAPSINLAWQGSYRFTEASGLGSDDPTRWTGVASLNVPLYSHSRYGEIDEKRAALRQAELDLADVERQAGQGVRQAIRDQQTAFAAVALARERAELAGEALGLTETAYAQGAGSSLELSDAQSAQVAAQVNLLISELQVQVNTLALLRALGNDLLAVVQSAAR